MSSSYPRRLKLAKGNLQGFIIESSLSKNRIRQSLYVFLILFLLLFGAWEVLEHLVGYSRFDGEELRIINVGNYQSGIVKVRNLERS